MRRGRALVLALACLSASRGLAAREISLAEAVALARANRAEVAQADAEVRLAELGMLGAQMQRVHLTAGAELTEQVQRLNVNAPEALCLSFEGLCNAPEHERLLGFNAGVEVPIWAGLAISAGVERAASLDSAARAHRRAVLRALTVEVTGAYWQARRADLLREVAERGLQRKASLAAALNARTRAGVVPPTDSHRAQAAALRQRALIAELTGGAQVARARLAAVLQVDDEVIPRDNPGEPPLSFAALPRLVAEAEQRRPDLQATRAEVAAQEQEVRVARGALWPQLSLFGRADGRNEVLGIPQDHPIVSFTAGVTLKWQILDSLTTYQAIRRAEIERDKGVQTHLRALALARAEVRTAYRRLETARVRRTLLDQALTISRQGYELLRQRYEGGSALLIELRDAEDEVEALESSVIDNDVELANAATELDVARGE